MKQKKSKGQIEDLIAKEATKFYVKILGVGPRESNTYILQDMVIVRLKGKLLPIEEKLLEGASGIQLVKDIRKALHEVTIKRMTNLIKKITHHKVISSHSDISTKTGEIVQVFIVNSNLEYELRNK